MAIMSRSAARRGNQARRDGEELLERVDELKGKQKENIVGAAARLSLNPFEAMTTITAKIVSQLTGDQDFTSPEALVAFALGMTLFVVTLILNVLALWIVRRYREQYE